MAAERQENGLTQREAVGLALRKRQSDKRPWRDSRHSILPVSMLDHLNSQQIFHLCVYSDACS